MVGKNRERARGVRLSLKSRFVFATIAGEVLFGLALGLTVGLYVVRAEAQQRLDFMQQTTGAIAASVMPMVADQETQRVEAQLHNVIDVMGTAEVECLSVYDSTGSYITGSTCEGEPCVLPAPTHPGMLDVFTEPQVLEAPIVVDGLRLATLRARFAPLGVGGSLASAFGIAGAVVLAVSFISLPWTAWLFVKSVAEPLEELREGANRLAVGNREVPLHHGRDDEIGDVEQALDKMASQIVDREKRLESSYHQLEAAYQLEAEANRALEELMRMKSDFVAVASHELRAPLAVIRLYSDLLNDGSLGSFDSATGTAHEAIGASVGRLSSIVSDLMDAALLERGMIKLEFKDVALAGLVAEVVRDAGLLYGSSTTQVLAEGEYPPVSIHVDPVRIRQILDNLISNAVKYSDGGGRVRVSMNASKNHVDIEVIDSGRGVPVDQAGHLFEYFGRLDPGENRSASGLGLGLAISERVARAHGGSLRFCPNEEGRGSVFTLRLPLRVTEKDEYVKVGEKRT